MFMVYKPQFAMVF